MPDTEKKETTKKEIRKEPELAETEEKEPEIVHLKTKTVPAIVMLLAGSVAAIDTFIQHYPLKNSLIIILATLLIFLFIGEIIKMLLDRVEVIVPEETMEEEGNDEGSEEGEESQPEE